MSKFNPPSTPQMADAMEVMVKKTKKELKPIVRDEIFADEALSTFLMEVESRMNSHHFTAASDSINDL